MASSLFPQVKERLERLVSDIQSSPLPYVSFVFELVSQDYALMMSCVETVRTFSKNFIVLAEESSARVKSTLIVSALIRPPQISLIPSPLVQHSLNGLRAVTILFCKDGKNTPRDYIKCSLDCLMLYALAKKDNVLRGAAVALQLALFSFNQAYPAPVLRHYIVEIPFPPLRVFDPDEGEMREKKLKQLLVRYKNNPRQLKRVDKIPEELHEDCILGKRVCVFTEEPLCFPVMIQVGKRTYYCERSQLIAYIGELSNIASKSDLTLKKIPQLDCYPSEIYIVKKLDTKLRAAITRRLTEIGQELQDRLPKPPERGFSLLRSMRYPVNCIEDVAERALFSLLESSAEFTEWVDIKMERRALDAFLKTNCERKALSKVSWFSAFIPSAVNIAGHQLLFKVCSLFHSQVLHKPKDALKDFEANHPDIRVGTFLKRHLGAVWLGLK